ncbi:hypothetical protein L218DRAFT_987652 [Marasmius fiardii PR-910]|nr:hypothetical protein L218DRAFT_987652 [Marasmius fiardii PR-910]
MSSSPKLTGSGSIQSHLSSASSRLRISSSVTTQISKEQDQVDSLPLPCSSSTSSTKIPLFLRLSITEVPQTAPLQTRMIHWITVLVKMLALFYCIFGIFYAPYKVYCHRFATSGNKRTSGVKSDVVPISPLSFLSDRQKLSRLALFQPEIRSLEVGLTPSIPSNRSITLCLWAHESEFLANEDKLVLWGAHWKGPISFLIATQDAISSATLLRSLDNLKRKPSLSSFSVHILHVQAHLETYSPNALLNFARLLASTPFVLMLPGGLNSISFHDFGDSILAQHNDASHTPSLITDPSVKLPFPLPELTPLLIRQEFPFWCTERFFYLEDRISGWNECLWQLWMEAEGKLDSIGAIVTHEMPPNSPHTDLEFHISQRLVAAFRTEMCDLRVKGLAGSEKHLTRKVQKRIDWVNHFCRQVRTVLPKGQ